ncbi:MAG TPA: carboxy terminal-processing peptidase, partial [Chitinophagaceae bacterium]|nr:carboxy terminal-processing peptidase [Chitinophagaceae bacterium]
TWYDKASVLQTSEQRINTSPSFNTIKETVAKLEKMNDKVYSLNLVKYKAEQKEIRTAIKKIDEINKTADSLGLTLLPGDEKRLSEDNDKLERRKQWMKSLSKDIYLNESVHVMDDMIKQTALAKNK